MAFQIYLDAPALEVSDSSCKSSTSECQHTRISFSHRKRMPVKLCDYHINGCTSFTSFVFVFCYCNVLPRTPQYQYSSGPDPGIFIVKIIRCRFYGPVLFKNSLVYDGRQSEFGFFPFSDAMCERKLVAVPT